MYPSMKDKNYWIQKLQLESHPEGGFYKEVYRSEASTQFSTDNVNFKGERNYMTSIYFLLDGENYSAFHRIKSDEMWYFHYGDPIRVHIIDKIGVYSNFTLGFDLENQQLPSAVVEAGSWFASETLNKNGYGLVSCAVSPGFDFSDFELATEALMDAYPSNRNLIERFLPK